MSPQKKPVTPLKFGQPEKVDWVKRGLFIAFVVLVLGGIVAMIVTNPKEKKLVCRTDVPTSLIGFGGCTTE